MKAMVLAAGVGLRMRPLSLLRAKPVLPVLNRPLLHWTLERLARHGVSDVVINLHHLPASVVRAVGDGSAFGLRVRYSREPRILGTGGGPRKVRGLLGDGPVLLVNGDVVFDFDLRALVARHVETGAAATLALKPNPDPERYAAVVTASDGRVLSIRGRPRRARGTLSLFASVHVIDPALLELLPPGRSDTVRDLYPRLIAAGLRVQGVRVRGPWYDLGTPSLYLASQLSLLAPLRHRVAVHPEASVSRAARLVRAVVGAGARIEAGSDVRGSVLWDRVRVGAGARVRGSILTSGVRIPPGARVDGKLVLRRSGRQLQVELGA